MVNVLGNLKTREEVLQEIRENQEVYAIFQDMRLEFQNQFVEFCMGVRGVKMTYDPFFLHIFNAEEHPERLSALLSQILGQKVKVKRVLPREHERITEKGSLLILDIVVELENGEIADVEIQKVGYRFPGQRASCYSSDMVMRQYERVKNKMGEKFTYKALKKVYTIVFMEQSSKEIKQHPEHYIHRGKWKFETGLELELLQEYYFVALDIFKRIADNKEKGAKMSELEAWLYFLGSDRPADIQKVIAAHPKFEEMYQEIVRFRQHPEEAIQMFSEALKILDENTVKYMIEEMQQDMEEKDKELEEKDKELEKKNRELEEKDKEIERLKKQLAKPNL